MSANETEYTPPYSRDQFAALTASLMPDWDEGDAGFIAARVLDSDWLRAHDAEVAANALRTVADTLGKDAITAAGLRMLADRKSSPDLGNSGEADRG